MPVFQTEGEPLIWQWAGAVRQLSPGATLALPTHRPGLSQVCPVLASSHLPPYGFYQPFTVESYTPKRPRVGAPRCHPGGFRLTSLRQRKQISSASAKGVERKQVV